jgi:hypothetical protein
MIEFLKFTFIRKPYTILVLSLLAGPGQARCLLASSSSILMIFLVCSTPYIDIRLSTWRALYLACFFASCGAGPEDEVAA